MRLKLLILSFCISTFVNAQEVVKGLTGNPELSSVTNVPLAISTKNISEGYVYNLNKVTLPFIDDFSSNNLKIFSTDTTGNITTTVNQYAFSVNGLHPDTVKYASDTTWQYTPDSIKIAANSSFQIIRFNAGVYPATVKDTINAWPDYSIYGTDTVSLKKNLLINFLHIYYVLKDDASLWTDRGVFVNANYPISPPSIGVATFDAINASGIMYANASVVAYVADSLVSKPMDLSGFSIANNLYLSFFLESQGYGDAPEVKDSLVLQFLDSNNVWRSVWNTSVKESWAVDSFFKFYVKLASPIFFHSSFQFRFFNYASIDGFGSDVSNRDQWHLDYVVLDKNRFDNDVYISDAAFMYQPKSLLNGYYSVPWNHFKSAGGLMSGTSKAEVANVSAFPATVNFAVQIKEKSAALYNSAAAQSASVPAGLTNVFNENYGPFVYTSAENDSAIFDIQYSLNTSLVGNFKGNDTVYYRQELSNFYAYDDGSVEAGYGFYNSGAEFAYKLPVLQSKGDTLRGVKIYFNEVLGGANHQIPFNIRVWANNNGKPGVLMYENPTDFPDTIIGLNKFLYYAIDKPFFVKDTIFIGFKQTTNEYINVGLDFNTANNSKMFYYSTAENTWKSSSVKGSVMFRPVMGGPVLNPYSVEENNLFAVEIYPNPASAEVFIVSNDNAVVTLLNIEGREVSTQNCNEGSNTVSLSGLSEGLYLLKIVHTGGKTEFRKLIVQW
ncbi:MAG: T9SS type A sorting domain-containing protein [Bacteroidetes bacterium]|nr:T9SS type A sorting domain-containing protein [Bacteroidota bacterium]